MNAAAELCPALRLDAEHEEKIVCLREPHVRGAFTFICVSCWRDMLDGKARREEGE
jgi:hypothetical protein